MAQLTVVVEVLVEATTKSFTEDEQQIIARSVHSAVNDSNFLALAVRRMQKGTGRVSLGIPQVGTGISELENVQVRHHSMAATMRALKTCLDNRQWQAAKDLVDTELHSLKRDAER